MKKVPFAPGAWHEISILWQGPQAVVSLDGKKAGTLKMANQSPNGASYIHFISTGSKPDAGIPAGYGERPGEIKGVLPQGGGRNSAASLFRKR